MNGKGRGMNATSRSPLPQIGRIRDELTTARSAATDLRERVKKLHPVAETHTTRESEKPADIDLWQAMLKELREIRKNTQKP